MITPEWQMFHLIKTTETSSTSEGWQPHPIEEVDRMRRRFAARVVGSTIMAAGTIAALTMPATASEPQAPRVEPGLLQAMQRDFGLTADQAQQRLVQEDHARTAETALRQQLGAAFGGAHFDSASGALVVGITDPAKADAVDVAGAKPVLVDDSEAELNATAERLNSRSDQVPEAVSGWYVDTRANQIVMTTAYQTTAEANRFVLESGVDPESVIVTESAENPQPYIDVIGGNAYYTGSGARCSVGFSVNGGFVTAGHCGTTGTSTSQPTGSFAGSSFPGNDYAYVQVAAGNTMQPWVNMYNGYARVVQGSQEAAIGTSVCRSGSTTGWHCGTILAKNQTVTYSQGTVNGLTRTNVCAEPGDSGGSFISGNQAQGMTSGGSGNCTIGGTTYFQPVNEVLSRYGLSLVRG